MNKLFFALALLFVGMSASAQHLGTEYRLKRVIPVAGRQGIAIDSNYYYVSDTKVLYKYDKQGNLVMKNDQPFQDPKIANHFGDIDVYNGEIYCGIEKFEYGRGYNIAVSIYDAETLKWKRDLPWSPESGQVEVSGLAVDREKNMVWMSDWVAVMCIAIVLKQDNTTRKCNVVRHPTGARESSLLTEKCFSLQMMENLCIIFLIIFMSLILRKCISPVYRKEQKWLKILRSV